MTAEVYATDEAGSLTVSKAILLLLPVLHQFHPVSHDKAHMSHDCHTSYLHVHGNSMLSKEDGAYNQYMHTPQTHTHNRNLLFLCELCHLGSLLQIRTKIQATYCRTCGLKAHTNNMHLFTCTSHNQFYNSLQQRQKHEALHE